MKHSRTNWHEAAVCAIRITLRDYENLLQYLPEYPLHGNAHRIDLLVIKKLSESPLPHPLAEIFSSYNLFEIKGISSSVTLDTYFRTVAYACLLISENPKTSPHVHADITLSFVSHQKPVKLIKYLTKTCGKTVANPAPGVYHIRGDIFPVQIIVTKELDAESSLYLRCLTNRLNDTPLTERLVSDYKTHQNLPLYDKYMDQLTNANLNRKGESPMCCEGIFRLYGTSSKEIAEKAVAPVMEQLDRTRKELSETTEKLNNTAMELNTATKQLNTTTEKLNTTAKQLNSANNKIEDLKLLLSQHGIAYS